jgi:superfamily II DNA or RNA helicase
VPRIFDNIDAQLLPALQESLRVSDRADFCVGYFNLRGWKQLDDFVEGWRGGEEGSCRLLVGMHRLPENTLRDAFMSADGIDVIDNQTALNLKKQAAHEFKRQLALGAPTNEDEAGLRRLSRQIGSGKVQVKLFLRHPLHAKLYLCHRVDPNNPTMGFLGSSNLTLAGLSKQGELNIDVLDHDACRKLQTWFNERWNDRWCIDISKDLVDLIDTSWARDDVVPPYYVYLKMAYHLSQEARAGLAEFHIPRDFGGRLLDFQIAAVKIAARHVNRRGGVILGDVVGLGKTLMATALARILEDQGTETLIICPKNLVSMWEDHVHTYRLRAAQVLSLSTVTQELPELRRYRVVIIDESHNLRNRDGKRFRAIQEYIRKNESKCVLLSATPYNKSYLDLSSQLRLFIPEERDLGIRPERKLKELGETEFIRRHQCSVRSLAAFEKSDLAEDWRELMRRFLVRRTRSFIETNYAQSDEARGAKYLTFEDGSRSYFPVRVPRTVKFRIDGNPGDRYSKLYSGDVVDAINSLHLPRYGLGNYVSPNPGGGYAPAETRILQGLSRSGKRLMGFCRTGLFKRLESSGWSFLLSIARHLLRNAVFLHALEHDQPLPIGTQDSDFLEDDEDADDSDSFGAEGGNSASAKLLELRSYADFLERADEIYRHYSTSFPEHFEWIRANAFSDDLKEHLSEDCRALLAIVKEAGEWDPSCDGKLNALHQLLTKDHARDKVLVFTQYAETAAYLRQQLRERGVQRLGLATGSSPDPVTTAWRFSPVSSAKRQSVPESDELRVLIGTDVLSEGLNLQDSAIVVNFDLPWAIIRLTQRAGRIDRIGQTNDRILCYSFLPTEGVERIIRLRRRVQERLRDNAEVVGSDEAFFDDERSTKRLLDLYHEKSGALDGDDGGEVDLASFAYQIWKNAIDREPSLKGRIEALPPVVYSTRDHNATPEKPEGVLVYLRTADDNDVLVWITPSGNQVTQSQLEILRIAECTASTPGRPRHDRHHDIVREAVAQIAADEHALGGQLGRPSGARFRCYERLKNYLRTLGPHRDLFITDKFVRSLERAVEDLYKYPLRPPARDTLNRQLRTEVGNEKLAELVLSLRDNNELVVLDEQAERGPPSLICSMGLFGTGEGG